MMKQTPQITAQSAGKRTVTETLLEAFTQSGLRPALARPDAGETRRRWLGDAVAAAVVFQGGIWSTVSRTGRHGWLDGSAGSPVRITLAGSLFDAARQQEARCYRSSSCRRGEDLEVTLVKFDDYANHANQVAALTNRRLLYIKRKELSRYPYALEYFPLEAWRNVRYRSVLALLSMLMGIIMVVFGVLILYFRITGELQGRYLWLAGVMILGGAALAVGVRRNVLEFTVGDRTLRWRSSALEFRETLPAVHQVLDLADKLGIAATGSPRPAKQEETPPYLRSPN